MAIALPVRAYRAVDFQEDTLIPTATNTLPSLSQTPAAGAKINFYIRGIRDYLNKITVTGTTVTVAADFNASYGFDIEVTDTVIAKYQID